MAIAYVPPGVTTVTESRTAPIVPPGGGVTLPALVGEARGTEIFTESIVLTGSTAATLAKSGIVLDDDDNVRSVTKTTTNEAIKGTNYILTQTSPSNGVIDGDDVTTIARITYPAAPTLTPTAGSLNGQYRYAVAWYFGDDDNDNPIESGIDESKTASVTLTSQSVNLSAIPVASPPTTLFGAATGRVIYRSKNLGTSGNPDWGPWYRIEEIDDLVTTTATDDLSDTLAAARPRAEIGINSGDSLFVQYNYADETYYLPTLFEDLQDVFQKYGASTDETGNIFSELSFGAHLAFLNGASQVICLALPQSHTPSDVTTALEKLEDESGVRVVVLLDGSASAVSSLSAHVNTANNKKAFRVGIVGRDGVAETVSVQALRDNAEAIQNEAIQMINVGIVQYRNSVVNRNINIGAQYAAAALAGMYAARLPQETLTKKSVAGLIGLGERRTKNAQDVDAASGLTVLEDRSGILRVRHSISTNRTSINTQEFAVTLAKHNMLVDVINAMEELVAGQIVSDDLAPIHIINIASSILDRKKALGIIYGYQGLRARPVSGDPTTYNLDWQYKPTYTINNITISFSINLDTGSTVLTGAGLGGSSGLIL